MIGLLGDLSAWVVGFADSDWAILALGLASFTESIFFPIPPDPLLVGIALISPDHAIWLGALVTLASVAGAVVGHWLGLRFGRPILLRVFPETGVNLVVNMFKRYGMWAVLLAAFTPLPYKVFAISAGALDLDRRTFILASLVGRGARFISLGTLVYFFGEDIHSFIEHNFAVVTIVVAVGLLAGVTIWSYVIRRRRTRGIAREADTPGADTGDGPTL